MTFKKIALVLVALVALGQAAYLTYGYMNQPTPDGDEVPADFVCISPGCGEGFSKTKAELVEVLRSSPDGAVECPKCHKALTKRAISCPSCKAMLALVGHGQIPSKCEKCGKQISTDERGVLFCPGG